MNHAKHIALVGLAIPLTLATLLGCADVVDEPEPSARVMLPVSLTIDDADAELGVYSLQVQERSDDELSEDAKKLAGVLLGAEHKVSWASEPAGPGLLVASVDGYPDAGVQYWPEVDGIEAFNKEVVSDRMSPDDVGPDEAKKVFEAAAKALVASGVVRSGQFDAANATLSQAWQGTVRSDGAITSRVAEYRFFAPLRVGGVGVTDGGQQDLGLEVAVHRTGRLASVEATGRGLTRQGDLAPVSVVRRAVSKTDMDRRVAKEYPDSDIVSVGVRYALPLPGEAGPSEPSQVYRVSRRVKVEGSEMSEMNELAVWLYYSLEDPARPPRRWPPLAPGRWGDPR